MRIGFTFNLKPALAGAAPVAPRDAARPRTFPKREHAERFDAFRGARTEPAAAFHPTPDAFRENGGPPQRDDPARFAEWDSEETIAAVAEALSRAGDVVLIEADADLPLRLREERPDLVFNMAEGAGGRSREAHVPALLELLGIPYTGGDPLTLALTLDKAMTKHVLAGLGVATPAFRVVDNTVAASVERPPASADRTAARHPARAPGSDAHGSRAAAWNDFPLPAIVKPLHEGSSIGVGNASLCRTAREVEERVREVRETWRQPAIVERFLPGREFTCALVGNHASLRAYPLVGLDFTALPAGANSVYGYEAKWVWDTPASPLPIFRCPADVDDDTAGAIRATAMAAFHGLGCRDWARIDVRLDEAGRPHVLEVNALPGVLPDPEQNSCYPKAARAAGLDFPETILAVLEAARVRNRL